MRADSNPLIGTVIGKAPEGLSKGTGVIRMLVTLRGCLKIHHEDTKTPRNKCF